MAPVLAMLAMLPLIVEGEVMDVSMAIATKEVNLEGGDSGNASLGGDFRHYCEGNPRNCRYVLMSFMHQDGMGAAFYHLVNDKELEMEGVKSIGELPFWVKVLLLRFVPACSLSYSFLEGKHFQMDPSDPEMCLWLVLFLGLAARELQRLFLLYIKGLVATYNRHRNENDETRLAALQEVLREVFRLEVQTWYNIAWTAIWSGAWSYYFFWYIIPNWTWLTICLLCLRCWFTFIMITCDLKSQQQVDAERNQLFQGLDRLTRMIDHQRDVNLRDMPLFPLDLQRDRPPRPAVPLPWMPSPVLIPENLDDMEIPEEFKCPISHNVMSQPAIWNGHTYEWEELQNWVHQNDSPSVKDPKTGSMVDLHLVETEEGTRRYTFPPNSVQPNMSLRTQIESFFRSNEASRGRPRTRASPSLTRQRRNATPGVVASS